VDKLNTELNAVLNDPAVHDRLNTLGITASPGGPERFGRDMARDLSRYAAVVKAANIKAE
jgi:tripartite-type tricarboxylate transporter receptor subunit TctC